MHATYMSMAKSTVLAGYYCCTSNADEALESVASCRLQPAQMDFALALTYVTQPSLFHKTNIYGDIAHEKRRARGNFKRSWIARNSCLLKDGYYLIMK